MFGKFMFTRLVPPREIFVVLQEPSLMPFFILNKIQNETSYEQ